jgi:hypothetical protein
MTTAPDDALVPPAQFDRSQYDTGYHQHQKGGL